MNLLILILLPLVTGIVILLCNNLKEVRVAALAGASLQMIVALIFLVEYYMVRATGNQDAMLFLSNYDWFPSLHIAAYFGIDGIAMAMILLTAFVVLAGVLVSWKLPPSKTGEEKLGKEFFFLLMLLSTGAYGFFVSLDLFTMFFFLELAVIPKFMLIGIWGSGQKTYSAMKLALMLMAGSALVLVGILGVYFNSSTVPTFDMLQLTQVRMPVEQQLIFFPLLFVGFGIFGALFPFHTWVPDGHSSAPTAGSMFLAGISMKLGGYGCLRVAVNFMPEAAHHYSWIIILLATIAIIYGAFTTMMQSDLKYINAYSSVSHCGFVLLGIGMLTQTSVNGAVLQMVSHGLMTALFFAVIGMLYDRTHTRLLSQLGGLLKVMPFICTVFVIAGLCSLGLPGFSGFVAEVTVLMGSWQHPGMWYRIATVLACASIVVTAVYILRAIGAAVMGPVKSSTYNVLQDANWNERVAAVILVVGIVIIGLAPFLLINLIDPGTAIIMKNISMISR